MAQGITVTEFILSGQKEQPEATGAFTSILSELTVAAKIIAQKVKKANLSDMLDTMESESVGEAFIQKLREHANSTIINRLSHIGHLDCMASKMNTDLIPIPKKYAKGNYILIFDPLGGITNIDVPCTIGTVFSILKKQGPGEFGLMTETLQPGHKQVAAGYFIYGSSKIMVYTTGNGVHGFTLQPSIGEFLLSHENIRIPKKGKTYSVNEGNYYFWKENVQNAIEYFKTPDLKTGRPYTARYTGSFVTDIHRNLLKGGIYMYPENSKDPSKPHGKLMLTCEVNPLAYIVEQAGGYASNGFERILDLEPKYLHQRLPVFMGSINDVRMAENIIQGKH
ncbi:MAG: class 1 fructose-bisphosphatase [Deltaproteobacteria bacterium]|nr:class 1 fructose-bisphosphatase [Deltaproteobacteria bacterium]MBW1931530.1 class 1 fructose-bisphosphatase [Deltaproteobacteria bacterium]MBW1938173.1 class 1 fructose-bisphosphatase [Deltaproteobacteria bacterium]MBW1963628.1 class 1 fructose-bisphosphatase [Deltaproteobacteria bacterium]MBW2081111.1 class 1 fructose-bisphosphatase [Deltaproteobacteria bacterium]